MKRFAAACLVILIISTVMVAGVGLGRFVVGPAISFLIDKYSNQGGRHGRPNNREGVGN